MADTYDAIVIGAGQAGPSLATRLANAGMKVAFVARHKSQDFYQRWRPGHCSGYARHRSDFVSHELLDDGSRFSAQASDDCRRQLHRARIWTNVPAFRK